MNCSNSTFGCVSVSFECRCFCDRKAQNKKSDRTYRKQTMQSNFNNLQFRGV